jgi:hypothetical protein
MEFPLLGPPEIGLDEPDDLNPMRVTQRGVKLQERLRICAWFRYTSLS